jgi:hypothetical protein
VGVFSTKCWPTREVSPRVGAKEKGRGISSCTCSPSAPPDPLFVASLTRASCVRDVGRVFDDMLATRDMSHKWCKGKRSRPSRVSCTRRADVGGPLSHLGTSWSDVGDWGWAYFGVLADIATSLSVLEGKVDRGRLSALWTS